MHEISTTTLEYVIEVLEDYRIITDDLRQEGEEYTAIDRTIDELIESLEESLV